MGCRGLPLLVVGGETPALVKIKNAKRQPENAKHCFRLPFIVIAGAVVSSSIIHHPFWCANLTAPALLCCLAGIHQPYGFQVAVVAEIGNQSDKRAVFVVGTKRRVAFQAAAGSVGGGLSEA